MRALLTLGALVLSGCAYRMPPPIAPYREKLRIVSDAPERYSLRLSLGERREYTVAADGRVTLEIPGTRWPCGVYLFNKIKVGGGDNPVAAKRLKVIAVGGPVRRLSLNQIAALPVDAEGFHLLTIRK